MQRQRVGSTMRRRDRGGGEGKRRDGLPLRERSTFVAGAAQAHRARRRLPVLRLRHQRQAQLRSDPLAIRRPSAGLRLGRSDENAVHRAGLFARGDPREARRGESEAVMAEQKIVWVVTNNAGRPEVIFGDEKSARAYAADSPGVVIAEWQVSRYEDKTVKAA